MSHTHHPAHPSWRMVAGRGAEIGIGLNFAYAIAFLVDAAMRSATQLRATPSIDAGWAGTMLERSQHRRSFFCVLCPSGRAAGHVDSAGCRRDLAHVQFRTRAAPGGLLRRRGSAAWSSSPSFCCLGLERVCGGRRRWPRRSHYLPARHRGDTRGSWQCISACSA